LRASDGVTHHCLVAAEFRERLAMSKQTTHRILIVMFYLKKLNEVDDKEQYRDEISNKFADFEN
jgi:hypothetical protein